MHTMSNVVILRSGVSSNASTPRVVTRAGPIVFFLVHGQQENSQFRAKKADYRNARVTLRGVGAFDDTPERVTFIW
jgi:hypothetical protein